MYPANYMLFTCLLQSVRGVTRPTPASRIPKHPSLYNAQVEFASIVNKDYNELLLMQNLYLEVTK